MQIKSIVLENVFGYANKAFNFDKEQRTLIIGQNNSGKSAFADAICFILYGDWPRREKLSTVIKDGQEIAKGSLIFHNGMKIIRTRNIRDEASLEIENFPKIIGNRNTDKQTAINDAFGDYKTYIRTAYMMRGFLSIADPALKPAERRALLRQFFNIDNIDTATKFARSEKSQFSVLIDTKNRAIETLKSQLSNAKIEDKKELEAQLLSITEELKTLEALFKEKEKYDKSKSNLVAVQTKIESIQSKISILDVQKPDKDKEIRSLTNSYKQIEKHYVDLIKAAQIDIDALKNQYNNIKTKIPSNQDIAGKNKEFEELSTYIETNKNLSINAENLNKEIRLLKNRLENVPEAITCPECGTDLSLNENGAVHRETVIQEIQEQIREKQRQAEEKDRDLEEYSFKSSKYRNIKQDLEVIDKLKAELESIKERGKNFKVQIDTYKNSGKAARDDFNKNVESVSLEFNEKEKTWKKDYDMQQALFADAINLKNDIENEVKNLFKDEFNSLDTTKNELTNAKHAKEMELDRIVEKEKADKNLKLSIKAEEKEVKAFTEISGNIDFWVTYFPVVEKVLLEDSISLLELETNKWLQKLSDRYSIEFTLKGKGVYTTIYENGKAWSLNSLGSGIGSRVALASTFALMSVLKKTANTVNYVFIDEALDNLDEEGREAFTDLLYQIEGQRFVISHDILLKAGNYDAIYEAKKTEKGSELEKV